MPITRRENFKWHLIFLKRLHQKHGKVVKYITYFICQYNKKALRNLIRFDYDNINEEGAKIIDYKIRKLELDSLLSQIPIVDKDIIDLLQEIKEQKFEEKIRDEVNKYVDEVFDTYFFFKNRGFSQMKTPDSRKIIQLLIKLYHFYVNNNIILDEYLNFSLIVEKGIEGLIVESLVDDRYEAKIKEFNSFIFFLATKYCKLRKSF
ncbi:MAG: hypothetical protein WKG06_30055 [Segetibacter sp.]